MEAIEELGKVWDELHAAGVNSGGTLPASEGVALLAQKLAATEKLLKEWVKAARDREEIIVKLEVIGKHYGLIQ